VALLAEALRYKSGGRGFDSRLSMEFFIDKILPLTQPLTEMGTGNVSWGVKAAGPRADITFMCRLY